MVKKLEEKLIRESVYTPHRIKDSPLSMRVLNTRMPRDYLATKKTLDNYDGLTDLREHVQNICSSLKLVIQDSHVMCKILPATFRGLIRAW